MKCEQVEELLSAYLDDVLASDEHSQITAHLQQCADCRTVLADFQRFNALLSLMPRIHPSAGLRERIFSSPEYLKLTGTFDGFRSADTRLHPSVKVRRNSARRPRLVALPGGRSSASTRPTVKAPSFRPATYQGNRGHRGLRAMQGAIAVVLLLTFGVGSFIGWRLWQEQNTIARNNGAITPPQGLPGQQPLSAGMRFVFLRDGTLWSSPADGSSSSMRLTPANVTAASDWVVSNPLPGHSAGDLLAYIDLQQGYIHTIRSDEQRDTTIAQPLLGKGISPSSIWDTDTGSAILHSLAWSKDNNMLAFIASPTGTEAPTLYILSIDTGHIQKVPVPIAGSVSHPVWSPDGIRVAFEVSHNGATSILDYNTQNHGILIIADNVSGQSKATDTLLTLDWSSGINMPAIVWSVGTVGQVHSIWIRHVGIGGTSSPQAQVTGNFAEARYSRNGNNGAGSWLLTGQAGHLWRLDAVLGASPVLLTSTRQISNLQWSLDGKHISYLESVTSGVGIFHIIDGATFIDTLIARGVVNDPAPAWSEDGQELVYSTGTQTVIVNIHTPQKPSPLSLHGLASAFIWSATSPSQLVVALSDEQKNQGVYIVDIHNHTAHQLDSHEIRGPIVWTQIP